MPTKRTRTALYSEAARRRLADAVAKAREQAGYTTTAQLARATGRAARAIYALENAEPTVGQSVLQAVGRTLGERLAGWDQDTPLRILEGADPPSISDRPEPPLDPLDGKLAGGGDELELVRLLIHFKVRPEVIADVISELRRTGRSLPTVASLSETDRAPNEITLGQQSEEDAG